MRLKKYSGNPVNDAEIKGSSCLGKKHRLKRNGNTFGWLIFAIVLILLIPSTSAFARKKIYIVTDMEGISGVFRWQQTKTKDSPLYDKASEYLMGDLSAVVRGLKEGGATEIIVLDGHGYQNVVPHLMESGVKYITGTPRPGSLYALDETVDAVVQLGAHAMKGTPDGVLNHTMSSTWKYRFWYNGVETGEIGIVSLAAGYYGIPVILVTGDKAACREANHFLGDQVVTVPVKEGLATEAAILYPFEETRQALYEGAKKAMAAIGKCKPYKIAIPFNVKLEYVTPDENPEKIRSIEHTYPDARHIYDILREEKPKN